MKHFILITLLISLGQLSFAQKINSQIDELFNEFNQSNHPGCVISIMKDNEVVFSKSYGQENIQYNIPNSTETIFNIGSVSKQFTAMGIVLLQQKGELSFDDNIRKYLPEMDVIAETITIRQLLHHTSGIRSTPEIFGLAGWRDGDAITTLDDYQYLCKQTTLNFTPGSEFMYSNSGYVLLAKIIEAVTNQSYASWMEDTIFLPLGMTNTFVDEANNLSNANKATPYEQVSQTDFIFTKNSSLDIGASNIYSTANDLSKWMNNFNNSTTSWENAFQLLQTTDELTNGEENRYAFGVLLDEFAGNPRIQHTGGVPGFLSYSMYYPEEKLTIVLLSNYVSREVNDKYMELTQLFLKNKEKQKITKAKFPKAISLSKQTAGLFEGDYWNSSENYPRKILYSNDTLWYMRDNGSQSPLTYTGNNSFYIGGINALVIVQFELNTERQMIVTDGDNEPTHFSEYDSLPISIESLEAYTGEFYSKELETTYTISLREGTLFGYHSRHGEFEIGILKHDLTDWSGFATSEYKRDSNGKIEGFYVSLNRVREVWFDKK